MKKATMKMGKRSEQTAQQRCKYRWQTSKWKYAPHHVIRDVRVKITRCCSTPIKISWNPKTLTTPNVGKDVEQRNSLAGGKAKENNHFDDSSAVSYETKHALHMFQQFYSFVFTQRKCKPMSTHTNSHTDPLHQLYSQLEAIKMSFNRCEKTGTYIQ